MAELWSKVEKPSCMLVQHIPRLDFFGVKGLWTPGKGIIFMIVIFTLCSTHHNWTLVTLKKENDRE